MDTLTIASKLLREINGEKYKYEKAIKYYDGETDVITGYPTTERSNMIITTNYVKKFVDEENSFATGNPITYISKTSNAAAVQAINEALSWMDEDIDSRLNTAALKCGTCYELYYLKKDGEDISFNIKTILPTEGRLYRDEYDVPKVFVRKYSVEVEPDIYEEYVDVYDDEYIYHCDETLNEIAKRGINVFGICPVGEMQIDGGLNGTIYNTIKRLQDNYEYRLSDFSNEIGDTRLAYLIIEGMELSEDDANKLKEKGVLEIDREGDVKWLLKDVNPEFVKTFLDTIEKKLYEVTAHIPQDTIGSNLSGVYLKNRLINLRNKVVGNNIKLRKCIMRRVRCLFNYLNLTTGTDYNWRDISVKITECVPDNDLETAQMISQLGDLVSRETKLSLLSFVNDPKGENDRAKNDREDNMIGAELLGFSKLSKEEEETDDKQDR